MLEFICHKQKFVALAISIAVLFGAGMYLPEISANGIQQTVCVLQPIDQGVGPDSIRTAFTVLQRHNINATYVGLVQELTDKAHKGCDVVVQFAMMNNNRQWGIGVPNTAPNVPFTISGNIITIYTRSIPVTPETGTSSIVTPGGGPGTASTGGHGGGTNLLMTNPVCMSEALGSYYVSFGQTSRVTCDPYAGMISKAGSSTFVPVYKISQALNEALKSMGL